MCKLEPRGESFKKKFAGRYGREGKRGKEKNLIVSFPLPSFIQQSSCWDPPQGQWPKPVEANIMYPPKPPPLHSHQGHPVARPLLRPVARKLCRFEHGLFVTRKYVHSRTLLLNDISFCLFQIILTILIHLSIHSFNGSTA
jgi:hypothetical protein